MGTRAPAYAGNYATTICPGCGKGVYLSRKHAKTAAKRISPGENLTPYRCRYVPDEVWHVGHSRTWRYHRYHDQRAALRDAA